MKKEIMEKIFEYASMPLHGTLSRKLRKGVKMQVNEGRVYADAVMFLGDDFIRITETLPAETVNTYYSWDSIASVRTLGEKTE